MAYGDFKDLDKRTGLDNALGDKDDILQILQKI